MKKSGHANMTGSGILDVVTKNTDKNTKIEPINTPFLTDSVLVWTFLIG
jgi:hypothetical protein